MGPNGSGKSTLAYALAGHPGYAVTSGSVTLDGEEITELEPDVRARRGLYLAFQYPVTIPGVKVADFLRHAVSNVRNPGRKEGGDLIPMRDYRRELYERLDALSVDRAFARRYLNDGFSGGEKKRMEIVQMAMLRPRFAFLDETDSGLDTDAVNVVSEGVAKLTKEGDMGVLIITHHDRLLHYNTPQFTHVMLAGQIVETGGAELAEETPFRGLRRRPRPAPRGRGGGGRVDGEKRTRAGGGGVMQADISIAAPTRSAVTAELVLSSAVPGGSGGSVRLTGEWDEEVTSLVIPRSVAEAIGAPVWRIRRCLSADGPCEVPETHALKCVVNGRQTMCSALVHGDQVRFGLVVLTGTGFVPDRERDVLVPKDLDGWSARIGRMVFEEPAALRCLSSEGKGA